MYPPYPQLLVDESMIGTKSWLSFIQFIKAKPVKWRIKVWICSDSVNGYICSFTVYTEKDPSNPVHETGLAYSVVMKLIEGYTGKGYTMYTDNYYASPRWFQDHPARTNIIPAVEIWHKNLFIPFWASIFYACHKNRPSMCSL